MPTTCSGMKISSKPIDSIPTAQSRSTAGSVPRSSVGYVAPNLRFLVPMSAANLVTRVTGCELRWREGDAQLLGREYLYLTTPFRVAARPNDPPRLALHR